MPPVPFSRDNAVQLWRSNTQYLERIWDNWTNKYLPMLRKIKLGSQTRCMPRLNVRERHIQLHIAYVQHKHSKEEEHTKDPFEDVLAFPTRMYGPEETFQLSVQSAVTVLVQKEHRRQSNGSKEKSKAPLVEKRSEKSKSRPWRRRKRPLRKDHQKRARSSLREHLSKAKRRSSLRLLPDEKILNRWKEIFEEKLIGIMQKMQRCFQLKDVSN